MVSIIIPHYNRSHLLVEALQSIIDQTHKNWEAIIIDDGSDDNPQKLIGDYLTNHPIRFITKKNRPGGASASRNLGAEMANGEYLLFLDSDDVITPGCLAGRIEFMEEDPSLDFAVFPQAEFNNSVGDSDKLFSKFFDTRDEYLRSFLRDEHPWQTSGPVWRKDAFAELGGFNESYTCMEDTELHVRALIQQLNFEVIKGDPDFFYRQASATEQTQKRFWENSIVGRHLFYKEMHQLLIQNNILWKYNKDLSTGIIRFMKYFLFARMDSYKNIYSDMLQWAGENRLITRWNCFLLTIAERMKNNPLRIKGIAYRLIRD